MNRFILLLTIVTAFSGITSCRQELDAEALTDHLTSQATFIVDGNLPNCQGNLTASFLGGRFLLQQGETTLVDGTWQAPDGHSIDVTQGGATTNIIVLIQGEDLILDPPEDTPGFSCAVP